MIPYPSSSPLPQNITILEQASNAVPIVLGATAVGAVSVGSILMFLRYLRPKPVQEKEEELTQEQVDQLVTAVAVQSVTNELTHICVNSSELEEIKQLLTTNRVRFRIMDSK